MSFMLLMTKLQIRFKKEKYAKRLCNDDVITVPDMLNRDKQLHFLSLRAYHCRIWYLVTIFVDDSPHYVINLQTSLKIHNQLYSTSAIDLSFQNMVLFEFLDLKHNFNHASFDHPKENMKNSQELVFHVNFLDSICP